MNIPAAATDLDIKRTLEVLERSINGYTSGSYLNLRQIEHLISMSPEILRKPMRDSFNALHKAITTDGGALPEAVIARNLRVALVYPLEDELARRQREANKAR